MCSAHLQAVPAPLQLSNGLPGGSQISAQPWDVLRRLCLCLHVMVVWSSQKASNGYLLVFTISCDLDRSLTLLMAQLHVRSCGSGSCIQGGLALQMFSTS